jgi:hypothetical protein
MARSAGRATFVWAAAGPIALMKQAGQPAANNRSGLVPSPAAPAYDPRSGGCRAGGGTLC